MGRIKQGEFLMFKRLLEKIRALFSTKQTRFIKSKSGIGVELYRDMPDGFADFISECYTSGKALTGEVDSDRKIKITKRENLGDL